MLKQLKPFKFLGFINQRQQHVELVGTLDGSPIEHQASQEYLGFSPFKAWIAAVSKFSRTSAGRIDARLIDS
jgi:hypothetical protein